MQLNIIHTLLAHSLKYWQSDSGLFPKIVVKRKSTHEKET